MDYQHQVHLFHEDVTPYAYKILGAHIMRQGLYRGVRFALWCPYVRRVSVVGDFNGWDGSRSSMERVGDSWVWSLFIPKARELDLYKYEIETYDGKVFLKADPYAFYSELRPDTASIVYDLDRYRWRDEGWIYRKSRKPSYDMPMNIYEVHIGSWRQRENGEFYTYRELAEELIPYVVDMGYTHVQLLPICEHPYDGSWGYQVTGYYSLTSRYGTPDDFKYFIDMCHINNIGVILDWVPAHFPRDAHGLARFNGQPLYEHPDPRRGEHPHWGTLIFDFGKNEVRNFLISNAMFWLAEYHIDGFRIDAVASMLYLDYGKRGGEWAPNRYGGNENLEAISFMQKLNEEVFKEFPNALMIAEESTAWPMVTRPTYLGGLGYNYKWNMGWMNDMLKFMSLDPIHRKWHHNLLTFSMTYAFSENYVLPLSHDEVVHGKSSLIEKMPGSYDEKFANLRLFYGYMMTHPGKKLMFMGGEFGQFIEWNYKKGLDWNLLEYDMHGKLWNYVRDLNRFYLQNRPLWEIDYSWDGFRWIDANNYNHSIISFIREGRGEGDWLIVVCNFTPIKYEKYRIGVPEFGEYKEVFNSDYEIYGGTGGENRNIIRAYEESWHYMPYSVAITIPPLSIIILKIAKIQKETSRGGMEVAEGPYSGI